MNLYLVRHGETELNLRKVYYGSTDCSLTEKGREQARALAPVFKDIGLDVCYVSPLKRAVDTATLLMGEKNFKRRTDDRLKEIDFGEWEGKSYLDLQADPIYRQWCNDWQNIAPPGGESFKQQFLRVNNFFDEVIANDEKGAENVLIVAHKGVLQQLMVLCLNLAADDIWRFDFIPGHYSVVEISQGYGILKKMNV